jgi:tetratricopeptide (TPR) repeat protein
MVEDDMQSARLSLEAQDKEKLKASRQIFENLIGTEINEKEFQNSMDKGIVAEFYHIYGNLLLDGKEYQKALDNFQKALTGLPDDPGLYLSITDTYFALGDFEAGLEVLKKAVDLDKSYAVYWDNIGDTLQDQKDYNGAIMAYERYFTALPEQVEALKKIGDCYKKLGDLDAAYESYQQFKKSIE